MKLYKLYILFIYDNEIQEHKMYNRCGPYNNYMNHQTRQTQMPVNMNCKLNAYMMQGMNCNSIFQNAFGEPQYNTITGVNVLYSLIGPAKGFIMSLIGNK